MPAKIYYKFVSRKLKSIFAEYDFKKAIESGETLTADGKIILCNNGFHACREEDIDWWQRTGARLFAVELGGRIVSTSNKVAGRTIRFLYELDYNKYKREQDKIAERSRKVIGKLRKKHETIMDEYDGESTKVRNAQDKAVKEATAVLDEQHKALLQKIAELRKKIDEVETKTTRPFLEQRKAIFAKKCRVDFWGNPEVKKAEKERVNALKALKIPKKK